MEVWHIFCHSSPLLTTHLDALVLLRSVISGTDRCYRYEAV